VKRRPRVLWLAKRCTRAGRSLSVVIVYVRIRATDRNRCHRNRLHVYRKPAPPRQRQPGSTCGRSPKTDAAESVSCAATASRTAGKHRHSKTASCRPAGDSRRTPSRSNAPTRSARRSSATAGRRSPTDPPECPIREPLRAPPGAPSPSAHECFQSEIANRKCPISAAIRRRGP